MTDNSLSSKIFTLRRDKEIGHPEDLLVADDVKEFIKQLKDWLDMFDGEPLCNGAIIEEVNKLAGKELI